MIRLLGVREEEGQSILFQPYKRFGAWEFGIEFFYQKKHNDEFNHGKINDCSIYTETYYEPIIKYAFENAGNLYLRTRFGHGKTEKQIVCNTMQTEPISKQFEKPL